MRITRLIPLATGVLLFAVTSPRVHAASSVIVFTEQSSSVLTATVGGVAFGSVTQNGADDWTWLLPANRPVVSGIDVLNPLEYWLDPESTPNTTLGNTLLSAFGLGGVGGIHISSDLDLTGSTGQQRANGYTSLDKFTFHYVTGANETFSVQFNDLGDGAGVPDSSSTAGMLLLSLAVVFGAARMRTARAL